MAGHADTAADPKLGATVGGVIAYLKKLNEESTALVVGVLPIFRHDSITAGVGAELFGALTRTGHLVGRRC